MVPISTDTVIPISHGPYRSQTADHAGVHGPWRPELANMTNTVQSVVQRCRTTLSDMFNAVPRRTAPLGVQGSHHRPVPHRNNQ